MIVLVPLNLPQVNRAITAAMTSYGRQLRNHIAGAVNDVAADVLSESNNVVPVDTGLLLKSGERTIAEPVGNTVSCEIGYSAEYAAYVHEDLTARHQPGKQAKFLETAVIAEGPKLPAKIVEWLAE